MSQSSSMSSSAGSIDESLSFTCIHEKDHVPPRNHDADMLFNYARWIQKKNILKEDKNIFPIIERYYRISAAWDHDKAINNLVAMFMRNETYGNRAAEESVNLSKRLIELNIPKGYYIMSILLEKGYGVEPNDDSANIFMRKAADLGDMDAQYIVGSKLKRFGITNPLPYNIGREMIKCAAEQGHAEAAIRTANTIMNFVRHYDSGSYSDALKFFQLAVKAGNSSAALQLEGSFGGPDASNESFYLGLDKDDERARRYKKIREILNGYDYLNATVEDINEIVPLPPAKLPPWDGEIKWVKEWKKNVQPPLPSEERIAEMAKEKGLDPKTGRPVKGIIC